MKCGSDLHLLGGYIPFMQKGDVLGHEFVGEVVEVGPDVRTHRVGDRLVVCSFIAGLTLRGAQMHGHRYIPMLLDRMERGERHLTRGRS